MRITNGAMVGNMLKYLQKNMSKLDNINQQLSSGKQFQRPSEAPIKVANSMQLSSLIQNNEQYKRNTENARNWLTSSESSLDDVGRILQRTKELAVYGANGSLSQGERDDIAEEVGELRDELINIGNTKLGDRYIFAGQATSTRPFNGNGDYQGDYNTIQWQTNPSTRVTVNVDGESAFRDSINALDSLYSNLKAGNTEQISNLDLDSIDEAVVVNAGLRAEVGAKMNRLDLIESRIEDEILNLTGLLSKNEDIDIAETITDMKMQESVYTAALSVGARVIQPSLVDFIK